MNIAGKTIWQQAAGNQNRNYADLCLKWDVILNGPGYAGAWPLCGPILRDDGWSSRKATDLWRFAEEMKDGDLVVLRLGTGTVLGVGQVVGDYAWNDLFGDVDGWDLQHVRRVRWLPLGSELPKSFETYALKQGDTTQMLDKGPVIDWLAALALPEEAFAPPLAPLPAADGGDLEVDVISEFLFGHGLASSAINRLTAEMGELVRIAKWYQRDRENAPSEHETVAYLVVPLLRALGWTPQRMAVEWKRVDVALFDALPRSDASLRVVVEAKKMDDSCLSAASQAMDYAASRPDCRRLVVTDGLRYGVYVRGAGADFRLHAYVNLTRLRSRYPILDCLGAHEALLAMSPDWRKAG